MQLRPCPEVRERLDDLRAPDEVRTPVVPQLLHQGRWNAPVWPPELVAGVLEPRRGFRFKPENLAFSSLIEPSTRRIWELGAGSGTLGLMAHYFSDALEELVFVEVEQAAASRLRKTIEAHTLASIATVKQQDIRELTSQACCDAVVFNPPYYPVGWGRESEIESVRWATHAHHGSAQAFFRAAKALLTPEGVAYSVFDTARIAQWLGWAADAGFSLLRLVLIEDHRDSRPPTRVWGKFGMRGTQIERIP